MQMWQSGFILGIMTDDTKFLHGGFLLNAGYVSVAADRRLFSLFKTGGTADNAGGLILVPQAFGELPVVQWLRFRIGVAYEFYFLKESPLISKSEMQTISFNFGLLFGDFKTKK